MAEVSPNMVRFLLNYLSVLPVLITMSCLTACSSYLAAADLKVADVLRELGDTRQTSEQRELALQDLRELGEQADQAIAGLLDFIGKESEPVELRCRAVRVLSSLAPLPVEQTEVLLGVLEAPEANAEVRWTIVAVWGEREELDNVLAPSLLEVVKNRNNSAALRLQCLYRLRRVSVGPDAIKQLAELLVESNEVVDLRLAVLDLLRLQRTPDAAWTDAAIGLVADREEDPRLRHGAVELLVLSDENPKAVSTLVDLVTDSQESEELRLAAAQALRGTVVPSPLLGTLLTTVLARSSSMELRLLLAQRPDVQASTLPGTVDDWTRRLADEEELPLLRRLAARSLGKVAGLETNVVQLCARVFSDRREDVELRLAAGQVLVSAGANTAVVLDSVEQVVQGEEEAFELREVGSAVLAEVYGAFSVGSDDLPADQLKAQIEQVDRARRLLDEAGLTTPGIQRSLASLHRTSSALSTEYKSRWRDRFKVWLRSHAGWVGSLGVLGVFALLGLVWVSTRHRMAEREAVARRAQIMELTEKVMAVDNPERSQAVEQLGSLGGAIHPVVPRLMETLRDPKTELDVRFAALSVLSLAGEEAGPAWPALAELVQDRDEALFVRVKALDLLSRITSAAEEAHRLMVERSEDESEAEILRLRARQLLER